jgi:predicted methyltransferase
MKKILLSSLVALVLPALAVPVFAADPAIDKSIASPERSAEDRARDARDKPAEVLAFAGVKPGMTVADIFSAGGYYTELLAGVVGPGGKVLAINNVPYANFAKDDIKKRFTAGRLTNVQPRIVEASHMYIEPKSVDLAIIVMAYHDVFWIEEKNNWPQIDTDGFIESVKRMLKPGGRLARASATTAGVTGGAPSPNFSRM